MQTDTSNTRHAVTSTKIGEITLVACGGVLTGLYYPGHWVGIERASLGSLVDVASDPLLSRATIELAEYLAGDRRTFDIPIRADGDEFQHRVWDLLVEIPFGETMTYGEIAERLGSRALARKVGQAVGYNPLSIVIPCHRVVGASGKLTGYAGGLERKKFLLGLEEPEAAVVGRLF
jgi:methylated-DNA-[protein]-cysteine S-methyltransferase